MYTKKEDISRLNNESEQKEEKTIHASLEDDISMIIYYHRVCNS